MVIGRPTSTKIPVTPNACRKRWSWNRVMYWSSPTKLTLNGVRRSLEVMSVKDIAIEDRRGISMNTQNTTAKGKANPHARIVRRRRRTLPEPSVFVFLVPRLMGSVSRSDGVGFGLQVLQALVNGDLSLVYLLEDAVSSGGHLGPGGQRRRSMVFFSWSPNAESLSLPESASSSHAF